MPIVRRATALAQPSKGLRSAAVARHSIGARRRFRKAKLARRTRLDLLGVDGCRQDDAVAILVHPARGVQPAGQLLRMGPAALVLLELLQAAALDLADVTGVFLQIECCCLARLAAAALVQDWSQFMPRWET